MSKDIHRTYCDTKHLIATTANRLEIFATQRTGYGPFRPKEVRNAAISIREILELVITLRKGVEDRENETAHLYENDVPDEPIEKEETWP